MSGRDGGWLQFFSRLARVCVVRMRRDDFRLYGNASSPLTDPVVPMSPRSIALLLALGLPPVLMTRWVDLPTQFLPVYGGTGGASFQRSCGSGKVLTGFTFRSASVIDALQILCRPVNSDGTLGAETVVGSWAGGGGGTQDTKRCSAGSVVTGAKIYHGWYVNRMELICRQWLPATRGIATKVPATTVAIGGPTSADNHGEFCEAPTQPVRGIKGREASFIDAVGFFCDEP